LYVVTTFLLFILIYLLGKVTSAVQMSAHDVKSNPRYILIFFPLKINQLPQNLYRLYYEHSGIEVCIDFVNA